MNINIMEWNIKGSASLGWDNDKRIETSVVDRIITANADVVVLVEFVVVIGVDYLLESLKNNKYIWFISFETGGNGILIAIKENLVEKNKIIDKAHYHNAIYSTRKGCNLLYIKEVPLEDGRDMSIFGCRMETGNSDILKDQYDAERDSFDKILLPLLEKDRSNICVLCGDFNNARCCGNLNKKFDEKNYRGKAQINYNLNLIKDSLDKIGFTMVDVNRNGSAIPTHKGYPIDHIFVRGLANDSCESIPVEQKLSDHNILLAKLIDNKEEYLDADEYPLNKDVYPHSYQCTKCGRTIKNIQGYSEPDMCDECYQNEE